MSATGTSNTIQHIVPEYNDVLCGSGKAVMNHPGNQAFRALVKARVQKYSDSHSYAKAQIKETIVEEIEGKGGRFLKKTVDGSWCILSHAEAVDKTSQALRDAKRLHQVVKEKPEEATPVNHQSRDDDPMQSMTASESLVEPIISLDGPLPLRFDDSLKKKLEEGPSLDSEDVTMLSSMFALLMSNGGMSVDDGAMMPTSSRVNETNANTPNSLDVLCGSGKAVMNHPGNMDFRKMVKTMVSFFSEAPGYMKTQISESIVQSIEACGGRFLKQNTEGVWCPISHSEAVEKTSQALRDAKRLTNRQKTTDSPKRDPVVSAPLSPAFCFPPPPPSEKVHDATVVEGRHGGDVAMSSFGPSIDDPSSVFTFDISGNMESVESLDNVYESKAFDVFGNGL